MHFRQFGAHWGDSTDANPHGDGNGNLFSDSHQHLHPDSHPDGHGNEYGNLDARLHRSAHFDPCP